MILTIIQLKGVVDEPQDTIIRCATFWRSSFNIGLGGNSNHLNAMHGGSGDFGGYFNRG